MICIRPANTGDLDALCTLYYEFHEFHVRGVPDRLRSQGDLDRLDFTRLKETLTAIMRGDDSTVLIAEISGSVAGLAEVYLREDDPANASIVSHRYGYLQSLAVTQAFRRRHIGQQLVEAAQRWARQKDATEMKLDVWEFDAGPLRFFDSTY